jgi:hypothetical protein
MDRSFDFVYDRLSEGGGGLGEEFVFSDTIE